jgi:protein-disulfide isomerase
MTDNRGAAGQDDHYQPWLRNQGEAPAPAADFARPAPLPTTGGRSPADEPPPVRPAAMSADELLARPLPMPTAPLVETLGAGEKVKAALAAFADWTLRLGERADIPARVERLELGRRAREAGGAIAAGLKIGAEKSGEAAKAAAAIAGRAGESAAAAAGPRVKAVADAARDGLAKGADSARAGFDSGVAKVGETARAIAKASPMPGGASDAPVIESQLDRLLADEDDAVRTTVAPNAAPSGAGLPLFSESASQPPVAVTPTQAASSETAAAQPMVAAPAPQMANGNAGPPPPPNRSGNGGGGGGDGKPWHRHPGTLALGGAFLLATGFAAGQYWTGPGVDRASTERVVHDYLLNNPEILPQAMQRLRDNQAAVAVNRLRTRIETPFSGAWTGAADGDVTLTVFTDYACTFCRASLPDLERLLREDPKLKVVFRELPILSPDSDAAARLALAAAKRGRYMPMHRALFASGNPDEGARRDAAVSIDVPNDAAVVNDPAIAREIDGNLEIARELGFDGTPSWVIGDRLLTGAVGYDQLRRAVAEARAS